ncbi:MAG: hypothetical protein ACOYT4_00095 [Nanoarchaeota archaeon]
MNNKKLTYKIEPICLDEYADLVKPKEGLVIFNSLNNESDSKGNDFSQWNAVQRNASYLLGKIGVGSLMIKLNCSGEYESPYKKNVDELEQKIIHEKFKEFGLQLNPRNSRWYRDNFFGFSEVEDEELERIKQKALTANEKFMKLREAYEKDKTFVETLSKDYALWTPGCFCCINSELRDKMRDKYAKGKLGILVPRDHEHLNYYDNNAGLTKIGPKSREHFLFVAPELSKK